jgi:hypothetical protein
MIVAKEFKQMIDYEQKQMHELIRKKEKYYVDLLIERKRDNVIRKE